MLLKSSESRLGARDALHVLPPSVVRKMVPCVPLAQAIFELNALTASSVSCVPLFCTYRTRCAGTCALATTDELQTTEHTDKARNV